MTSRRFSDAIVPLFRTREVLKCSFVTSLPGFTDALRSVSQGRASAAMTPAGYRPTAEG